MMVVTTAPQRTHIKVNEFLVAGAAIFGRCVGPDQSNHRTQNQQDGVVNQEADDAALSFCIVVPRHEGFDGAAEGKGDG